MRCEDAVHYALLTNPAYRDLPWVKQGAVSQVTRHFRAGHDTAPYLMVLPTDAALAILREHMPRIVRTQRSTGGWKIKDTHRISLGYLRAYQYAALLPEFVRQLRYDPNILFADGTDLLSFVARNRVLSKPRNGDAKLGQSLLRSIQDAQRRNGSWDDSVLATTISIHQLLDLGAHSTDRTVRAAAEFLFSCQMPKVDRLSPNHGGVTVAHDMFSNPDRSVEFGAAAKLRPEWNPAALCYNHLPMVQTGMAIRCLNAIGYERDARVLVACQNLVDIHETYGGYCDTMIRIGVIASKKANKSK